MILNSHIMHYQYQVVICKHNLSELFHYKGRYHIEISPLICTSNQWTGFYMITASVMKELRKCEAEFSFINPLTTSVSHHIKTSKLIAGQIN